MSTHAAIRPALPTISVMVSRPTSGRPMRAAEVPNPVMYTAGNPASSTSRADSGSNAPGATIVSPESSSARSRAAPPGLLVSRAVTLRPAVAGAGRDRQDPGRRACADRTDGVAGGEPVISQAATRWTRGAALSLQEARTLGLYVMVDHLRLADSLLLSAWGLIGGGRGWPAPGELSAAALRAGGGGMRR